MIKIFTPDELETQYDKLTDILQDALFDDEIAGRIYDTGKSYGLSVDNRRIAGAEAGNIVLGLIKPDELSSRLAARIGIPLDKAKLLAKDILQNILSPLTAELKRVYGFELILETAA